MKLKLITTWTCLIALLFISTYGYGASGAVSVTPTGISFPDNSVQTKAAVLPVCSSGEVIVNNLGAWLCGSILPVDKGIATCVSSVCAISACQSGWGNCDSDVLINGCETSLTTTLNCGACGNVCPSNNICTAAGVCQLSPNSPASLTLSGTPAAGFINNLRSVVVTANVQKVATGPVPVGTTVSFAITGGSGGSLSSPTATTDVSGNASVTLNSTLEGNITVTATAAPATNNAIISFSNPNKPGAVALAVSPASGVANNVPVTLTATVSPADVSGTIANGTPVTFTILTGTGTFTGGLQTLSVPTTNGGVASVILDSTVAGTVGVTAAAGTTPVITSSTLNVPFITQPTQAIVVLQTAGAIPVTNPITSISSIGTDVTFSTNKGLTFVNANISGPVTSCGFNPAVDAQGFSVAPFSTSFMAANLFAAGQVRLGLISAATPQDPAINALITTTGRFASVRFSIAAGNFPSAADFGLINSSVDIAGITVQIQSVTIQ